jgi:hypothetical protein
MNLFDHEINKNMKVISIHLAPPYMQKLHQPLQPFTYQEEPGS